MAKSYCKKIDCGFDFLCLYRELLDDNSSFLHNLDTILDRYKEGDLYGLRMIETGFVHDRGTRDDEIFCRNLSGEVSFYLLSCICTKKIIQPKYYGYIQGQEFGSGKENDRTIKY